MIKISVRSKIATVAWAIKTAWNINGRLLVTMSILVATLAVLPAISLGFNRETIAQLSTFIADGSGSFGEVLPVLLSYGAILALIGLSTRINTDFIGTMMDNAYRYGTQEFLMNAIHEFEVLELMRRNVNEDFNYIVRQSASLNRVISSLCAIGGKAFSIVSLCMVAWTMSRPVFAITVVYVVLVVPLSATFSKSTRFNYPKFRKAEVKAQYLQNMPKEGNIAKEIRVYGCADEVIASWKASYAQRMDMELDRFKATEKRTFIMGMAFYLFLAGVVVYLLFMLEAGQTAPDVLLATFTLCISLFAVVSTLSRDLLSFDESLFSLEQQKNLLDLASIGKRSGESDACGPADEQIVFRARDVSFSYGGGKLALEEIDLEIRRGEVIALIGENGSGKTTLVKLLIGLFEPTSGELLFCGQPYAEGSVAYLSRRIGAFFQDFYLFHHSLAENVSYGDVDSIGDEERIREAIRRGGASKVLEKLPHGIDTLVGRRIDKDGVELSGGEKQLIATARAYMSDKDILIFDEPASMLDPLAEIEQFRSIRSRIGQKTGVLISHRVGFARLADRIVMMEGGRIVEVGTHDELVGKDGPYAAFFREQAQWYETEPEKDAEKAAGRGRETRA